MSSHLHFSDVLLESIKLLWIGKNGRGFES